MHIQRAPRTGLCYTEKPVLPKELHLCRRLDRQSQFHVLPSNNHPVLFIGVEHGGGKGTCPPHFCKNIFRANVVKNSGIFVQILRKIRPFSAKCHAKFGHFVNFSYIYFWAKKILPTPKVDSASTPVVVVLFSQLVFHLNDLEFFNDIYTEMAVSASPCVVSVSNQRTAIDPCTFFLLFLYLLILII